MSFQHPRTLVDAIGVVFVRSQTDRDAGAAESMGRVKYRENNGIFAPHVRLVVASQGRRCH